MTNDTDRAAMAADFERCIYLTGAWGDNTEMYENAAEYMLKTCGWTRQPKGYVMVAQLRAVIEAHRNLSVDSGVTAEKVCSYILNDILALAQDGET
jgi:hypothetical protein